MPWVTFTQDFNFSPGALGGRVSTAYKSGMTQNVTRECADIAIGAGKAKRAANPRRIAEKKAERAKG